MMALQRDLLQHARLLRLTSGNNCYLLEAGRGNVFFPGYFIYC